MGEVGDPALTASDAPPSSPADTRPRKILAVAAAHGQRVHKSRTFDVFVGIGLVTYGIVHVLIACIAVKIAWTGAKGNDSQDAALAAMAETVFGEVLLWLTALGLAALALWQIFETIWRRHPEEGRLSKAFGRVGSTFSAVAYLTLCVSAARVALAGRAAREGRRTPATTSATEELLLRFLIIVIGVVFVVLAVRSVYRGLRRRFGDDLIEQVNPGILILGQAGYIGKGITLGIVGALMIITAIDGKTGPPGIEAVLRLLNLSPAGGVLLVLKAIGLALFGVYCFAWAANRRR
ncbi:MAG: DUF1206 domain-containing protein [Nakamurella sp.]